MKAQCMRQQRAKQQQEQAQAQEPLLSLPAEQPHHKPPNSNNNSPRRRRSSNGNSSGSGGGVGVGSDYYQNSTSSSGTTSSGSSDTHFELPDLPDGTDLAGRYKIKQHLGRGSFGSVYQCEAIEGGGIVAVKIASRQDCSVASRELELLLRSKGPHVVEVIEDFLYQEHHVCIVMECCPQTLDKHLRQKPIREGTVEVAMLQLVSGTKELHCKNVMHRDLKADNILVTEDGIIKIADFGLATTKFVKRSAKRSYCGTYAYDAPEKLLGWVNDDLRGPACYGKPADMFAIGIIWFKGITGKKPFSTKTPQAQLTDMITMCGNLPADMLRRCGNDWKSEIASSCRHDPDLLRTRLVKDCRLPGGIGPLLLDLLKKLLDINPLTRITAAATLNHPYFVEVREQQAQRALQAAAAASDPQPSTQNTTAEQGGEQLPGGPQGAGADQDQETLILPAERAGNAQQGVGGLQLLAQQPTQDVPAAQQARHAGAAVPALRKTGAAPGQLLATQTVAANPVKTYNMRARHLPVPNQQQEGPPALAAVEQTANGAQAANPRAATTLEQADADAVITYKRTKKARALVQQQQQQQQQQPVGNNQQLPQAVAPKRGRGCGMEPRDEPAAAEKQAAAAVPAKAKRVAAASPQKLTRRARAQLQDEGLGGLGPAAGSGHARSGVYKRTRAQKLARAAAANNMQGIAGTAGGKASSPGVGDAGTAGGIGHAHSGVYKRTRAKKLAGAAAANYMQGSAPTAEVKLGSNAGSMGQAHSPGVRVKTRQRKKLGSSMARNTLQAHVPLGPRVDGLVGMTRQQAMVYGLAYLIALLKKAGIPYNKKDWEISVRGNGLGKSYTHWYSYQGRPLRDRLTCVLELVKERVEAELMDAPPVLTEAQQVEYQKDVGKLALKEMVKECPAAWDVKVTRYRNGYKHDFTCDDGKTFMTLPEAVQQVLAEQAAAAGIAQEVQIAISDDQVHRSQKYKTEEQNEAEKRKQLKKGLQAKGLTYEAGSWTVKATQHSDLNFGFSIQREGFNVVRSVEEAVEQQELHQQQILKQSQARATAPS